MINENASFFKTDFNRTYIMQLKIILKKLIKDKGISIVHLSRTTKIPVQTIHGWLNGSRPKNITQIKVIADYFNVSIDYLCFGIEMKMNREHKNKNELIDSFKDEINAGVFEVILRKIKN